MDRMKLRAELSRDEGRRRKPYTDTVGKMTIGVGRNLDDVGLTDAEVDVLLDNDIDRVMAELDNYFPWWINLGGVRCRVLANMCFNLGITKLRGFTKTLKLMEQQRYAEAADAMLQSKWATQVGQRAIRLSNMMRTGHE